MAVTDPYTGDIADRVTRDIRHHHRVSVLPVDGIETALDVQHGSLQVQFSEDWSPHIRANLTVKAPDDADLLDLLDPRTGCRLLIDAGYILPGDVEDVHLLADVGLRTRDVNRPDNTVTLSALSDEALAQDYVLQWGAQSMPTSGVPEAVRWLTRFALQPNVPTVASDFPDGHKASALTDFMLDVGTDLWNPIEDIAARADVWVHCDGERRWRIRARPQLGAAPAHRLEVGAAGTLLTTKSTLSRDSFYNAAVLEYRWKDTAGNERVVYGRAQVTSGDYRVQRAGYKTYYQRYERPITQAQANAAAATRVRNLVTRGRSLELSAAAAYWLRPGMTVAVTLPNGEPAAHIIQSITFQPSSGLMSLTTRQPLNVTIETGE